MDALLWRVFAPLPASGLKWISYLEAKPGTVPCLEVAYSVARNHLEQLAYAVPEPSPANWTEFAAIFGKYVGIIYRNEMDPGAALQEASRQINAVPTPPDTR
jgi:hypothetical protein